METQAQKTENNLLNTLNEYLFSQRMNAIDCSNNLVDCFNSVQSLKKNVFFKNTKDWKCNESDFTETQMYNSR
jgi:hypothetical protein